MTNETTNTELAAIVPELWPGEIVQALYDEDSVLDRVLNKADEMVKKMGDIVHIPVAAKYAAQSVSSSDGSFSVQQKTIGDVPLTINQQYAVGDEVLGLSLKQSMEGYWNEFPKAAGQAIRDKMSNTLLALYASFTTNGVGDGAGHVGEDELLAAIAKLLGQSLYFYKAPDEFTWAFKGSDEWAPIRKLGLLDYSKTGEAGKSAGATAQVASIMGAKAIFTQQVTSTGGTSKNLLFHKSALACAVQKEPSIETDSGLSNRKITKIIAAWALWGVKVVDETRGVLLNMKNG